MRRRVSSRFCAAVAVFYFLSSLPHSAIAIAAVADLALTKVPPNTKVSLKGEGIGDTVEAKTGERDGGGRLLIQLGDRNWQNGKYILTITEASGSSVAELIALADGSNQIDVSTLLGETVSQAPAQDAAKEPDPKPSALGTLFGALVPGGISVGGRRGEGSREREEIGDRRERVGGRGGAGINVGGALIGGLVGSIFSGSGDKAQAAAPVPAPEFVVDRVLATIPIAPLPAMQALAEAIAADHNLALLTVNPLDSVGLGLAEYRILDGLDPLNKATELAADARVESAQPEFIYETTAKQEQLFYGPRLMRVNSLPASVSGSGIKVAVIDTGIDFDRAEIKGKILEHVDMTGKGFTADVHGTMLAGIIAAERSAGIGVAPNVALLAVKSCQAHKPQRIEGVCWSSTLTRGIDFANTKGARVINLSVGGPQDRLLTRLVNEAVKRNIIVVAAVGNDGLKGRPRYPAALDNVVAVTAIDIERRLYDRATRGKFVDVSAPGVEIVSIGPGNRFPISSGTSFAAAYVTGTIALLLEQKGSFVPQDVQALLEKTAGDLGAPGKDEEFGSGLVDICQAIGQLGQPDLCR